MAITDDIFSVVLILSAVLVAGILAVVVVVSHLRTNVATTDANYRQDYYTTTADAFLHLQENTTNTPFNILLGDYIASGTPVVVTPNGSVDVRVAAQAALDELFGKRNYYLKMTPKISDVRISFVLDGTDSLKTERQIMAETMKAFKENVSRLFNESGASVNITVYILSGNDQGVICAPFSNQNIQCRKLGFPDLYNKGKSLQLTPPAAYSTYQSYAHGNPKVFYEADWIAGIKYVAEGYNDIVDQTGSTGKLHIIIPMANKLSTSSIDDACFRIDMTAPNPWSNYVACALCASTCPVSRSNQFLLPVAGLANKTTTLIIPVYSSRCSFVYDPNWNNILQTPINTPWVTFPITTPLCAQDTCGGCKPGNPPSDLHAFCFHDNCHAAVRNQMEVFANSSGGVIVDIDNVNELSQEVMDAVNAAVTKLGLEVGVYNESRHRYVIERNILVPDYGKTPIRIWAYDPPVSP